MGIPPYWDQRNDFIKSTEIVWQSVSPSADRQGRLYIHRVVRVRVMEEQYPLEKWTVHSTGSNLRPTRENIMFQFCIVGWRWQWIPVSVCKASREGVMKTVPRSNCKNGTGMLARPRQELICPQLFSKPKTSASKHSIAKDRQTTQL